MRIDKFLKVSRLIRRRTLAKQVADQGRITINDKVAKASSVCKRRRRTSHSFWAENCHCENQPNKKYDEKR